MRREDLDVGASFFLGLTSCSIRQRLPQLQVTSGDRPFAVCRFDGASAQEELVCTLDESQSAALHAALQGQRAPSPPRAGWHDATREQVPAAVTHEQIPAAVAAALLPRAVCASGRSSGKSS